jgi:hypothetical protein
MAVRYKKPKKKHVRRPRVRAKGANPPAPNPLGIEWAVAVGGGRGLFPNLAEETEGSALARLKNGARVLLHANGAGEQEIVRYIHGPSYGTELERLGIADQKFLRVRQVPDHTWENGPCPPELADFVGKSIPEHLRGCVGTVLGVGPYKYAATVRLELHRPKRGLPGVPRQPREKLALPFIWLEPTLTAAEPAQAITEKEAHR